MCDCFIDRTPDTCCHDPQTCGLRRVPAFASSYDRITWERDTDDRGQRDQDRDFAEWARATEQDGYR